MKNFNDEKTSREAEIFFALSMVMINVLIFSATTATGWFFYRLIMQSSVFEISMHKFQLF